jgi:hypothetical protein
MNEGRLSSEWGIVKRQMSYFTATSVYHGEIKLSWIFIVLAPEITHIGLHSDTLSWFRANRSLLFLLNAVYVLNGETTNTNVILFSLSRPGFERTQYQHANHYTTDAVSGDVRMSMQTLLTWCDTGFFIRY